MSAQIPRTLITSFWGVELIGLFHGYKKQPRTVTCSSPSSSHVLHTINSTELPQYHMPCRTRQQLALSNLCANETREKTYIRTAALTEPVFQHQRGRQGVRILFCTGCSHSDCGARPCACSERCDVCCGLIEVGIAKILTPNTSRSVYGAVCTGR